MGGTGSTQQDPEKAKIFVVRENQRDPYFIFERETKAATKTKDEQFTISKAVHYGQHRATGHKHLLLELSGHGHWYSRMRNRWFTIDKSKDFLKFLCGDKSPVAESDKKIIEYAMDKAKGPKPKPEPVMPLWAKWARPCVDYIESKWDNYQKAKK